MAGWMKNGVRRVRMAVRRDMAGRVVNVRVMIAKSLAGAAGKNPHHLPFGYKKTTADGGSVVLAERGGFEPPIEL